MKTTLALIAALVAALYSASTWAQDGRPSAAQIISRAYHPDCHYPDLRADPDFRVCNYHLLGRARTTETKGPQYVRFRILATPQGTPWHRWDGFTLESSWLGVSVGRAWPGVYFQYTGVPQYLSERDTVYSLNIFEMAVGYLFDDSYASGYVGRAVAGGPGLHQVVHRQCDQYAECNEAPWYRGEWNTLTPDQVLAALARFRAQVSRGCNIGIQPGGLEAEEVVVLTLSEDGSIAGSCEPNESDAEAQGEGEMQAAPLPYGSHSLMPSAFHGRPTLLGELPFDQSQWRELGREVRHLEPLNGEREQ